MTNETQIDTEDDVPDFLGEIETELEQLEGAARRIPDGTRASAVVRDYLVGAMKFLHERYAAEFGLVEDQVDDLTEQLVRLQIALANIVGPLSALGLANTLAAAVKGGADEATRNQLADAFLATYQSVPALLAALTADGGSGDEGEPTPPPEAAEEPSSPPAASPASGTSIPRLDAAQTG